MVSQKQKNAREARGEGGGGGGGLCFGGSTAKFIMCQSHMHIPAQGRPNSWYVVYCTFEGGGGFPRSRSETKSSRQNEVERLVTYCKKEKYVFMHMSQCVL